MALIDKLKSVADAIREKTGSTELMTIDEMTENIEFMDTSGDTTGTYILVDEEGNELAGVLLEEEVELTATVNDIRLGTTAVTEAGVTEGEKEIPNYLAEEGKRAVRQGEQLDIPLYSDMCHYTHLQVIVCEYNTTLSDSVSAEKVAIGDNLYAVGSADVLASVTVDADLQTIKLGLSNDNESSVVVRYTIIKEDM